MGILRKLLFVGLAFTGGSVAANAQNGWFYGLDGTASNFYTSQVLSLVESGINSLTKQPLYGSHLGFTSFKIKENGDKVDLKYGDPYGFSMADLLNDVEFGVKVGYMSPTSPIGAYVKAYYGFERFKTKFIWDTDYMKHKIHSFIPGVGIRISPFVNMLDDNGWYPFAELGTSYVYRIKYDGPYGTDKDQLNNGMRMSYAIGAGIEDDDRDCVWTVLLGMDMDNFDFFNKDYSTDGGTTKPFAYTSSHNYYFYLKLNVTFDL